MTLDLRLQGTPGGGRESCVRGINNEIIVHGRGKRTRLKTTPDLSLDLPDGSPDLGRRR